MTNSPYRDKGKPYLTEPTNEMAVRFEAQIREVLPTADDKNICLGLEFLALEANPIGRDFLQQLHNFVGLYYQTEPLITA